MSRPWSIEDISSRVPRVTEETPRRPNRQQERTERSTLALLQAASQLIVEGGLDSLTFAAIGERAGYSRGLLTARFGNKDGLIEALLEHIVSNWSHDDIAPDPSDDSGREAVIGLLGAITAQADRDPAGLRVLYALMFEAGSDQLLRVRFAEFHEAMRADFETMIRRGKRDGSIDSKVSPRREAVLIVAGLRGIAYQWQLDPERFDPVDALRYLVVTTEERLRT